MFIRIQTKIFNIEEIARISIDTENVEDISFSYLQIYLRNGKKIYFNFLNDEDDLDKIFEILTTILNC